VVANVSIASLNLSLLVNTVGFYQVRRVHAGSDRARAPARVRRRKPQPALTTA
jgi:hypothetical protein